MRTRGVAGAPSWLGESMLASHSGTTGYFAQALYGRPACRDGLASPAPSEGILPRRGAFVLAVADPKGDADAEKYTAVRERRRDDGATGRHRPAPHPLLAAARPGDREG